MSNRPIVLIGAGGIVESAHLPAYQKAGLKVIGITDLDQQKARNIAKKFNVPNVYDSVHQATIHAPEHTIFDIAIPASGLVDLLPTFRNGSTLLIQKPMGENIKQAQQIKQICRQKNFTANVNFQLRFAPQVTEARKMINQGTIGELHDIEMRVTVYTPWHLWDFLEKCARVEILYHSIHYIDLIRSFWGNPIGVLAKTTKHPEMMNMASSRSNIIMDYGDIKRANITTNHGHKYGLRHQESYLKFEGTKGAIKICFGLLMDYPKGTVDSFEYHILENQRETEWISKEIGGTWFPDAFIGSILNIMQPKYTEKRMDCTVEDAYKTMACVEAAYQSNQSNLIPTD